MEWTPEPPTYLLSRWLFLRLLGAVYLVAFASLAVQITGLVGEHGIMPAGPYLEWAHSLYGREAYRLLPTVFWIDRRDLALRVVTWGGAVLSLLLILGLAPLALLQLSIAATGNYGFFNALALVLCVPVLDDRLLRPVLPLRLTARAAVSPARRVILLIVGPAFLVLSLTPCAGSPSTASLRPKARLPVF